MSTDQEFAELASERMPALLRYAHLLTGDRGRVRAQGGAQRVPVPGGGAGECWHTT